jgi:CheY-like chemotaxis protein
MTLFHYKSVHEFKETKQNEAIEKFKEQNVDLILIDVQMPDINGYEATKEIRELNSDVIIITVCWYGREKRYQESKLYYKTNR